MRFAVKKMQKNTPCKKCVTFERAGGESLVSREAHLVGKRTAGRRELKVKSAKLQEFVVRRNWAGEKAKSLTTYKERRIKKYFPQTQINFCLRASVLHQQPAVRNWSGCVSFDCLVMSSCLLTETIAAGIFVCQFIKGNRF